MYEDQLPENITQKEYDQWFAASRIEDGVRVGPEFTRAADSVAVQSIKCACGYIAIRFNQVPLTKCPKCSREILEDLLDAEYIE